MDLSDEVLHGRQQRTTPDHHLIAHILNQNLRNRMEMAIVLGVLNKTILINRMKVSVIFTMLTTNPNQLLIIYKGRVALTEAQHQLTEAFKGQMVILCHSDNKLMGTHQWAT
jgi:hypothetical protein